jgi:hypothetical protein
MAISMLSRRRSVAALAISCAAMAYGSAACSPDESSRPVGQYRHALSLQEDWEGTLAGNLKPWPPSPPSLLHWTPQVVTGTAGTAPPNWTTNLATFATNAGTGKLGRF